MDPESRISKGQRINLKHRLRIISRNLLQSNQPHANQIISRNLQAIKSIFLFKDGKVKCDSYLFPDTMHTICGLFVDTYTGLCLSSQVKHESRGKNPRTVQDTVQPTSFNWMLTGSFIFLLPVHSHNLRILLLAPTLFPSL